MKTGLESLDTGAPEITYSGNQGPKSPQEDQQKMAEFQMAQLEEEYAKYVFEMEEQGLEPMSMQQFMEQAIAEARQDVKDGGVIMQGGVKNYLGKQKTVSNVPLKWQSGPDKPDTELAYITKAEKDLLLKEDIHGSLQDGPNMGPGGIMSLDSFGDVGGGGQSGAQADSDRAEDRAAGDFTGATTPGGMSPADVKLAEAKSGTDYDKFRGKTIDEIKRVDEKPSFNILDFIPGIGTARRLASMFGPVDNKAFFKEKVLTSKNPQGYDEDDYEDYMAARMAGTIDAYGNPIGGNIGNNNDQQIISPLQITTAPITTDIDTDTTGATTDTTNFVNRFAPVTSLPFADYKGGIEVAADGGRIGYADGGITDLRQGYFLGKLVKKATRAVKKIVKSPIGKAALIAGGFGLAGMGPAARLFSGGKGLAFKQMLLGNIGGPGNSYGKAGILQKMFLKDPRSAFSMANISPFKTIGLASALPLLMPQEEQEDDDLDAIIGQTARGPRLDIPGIRKQVLEGNVNPIDFPFLQPTSYAANGGRIGLMDGGIGKLRGALSKEMFGYDDDEDDVKKLALGGSAGMPPITMVSGSMDSMSFPDDESTGITQATPTATLPNQMPRPRPMMDPRMMQMMMAQRGMMQQPRIMAQEGGMMDMGGMEKDYRNEGGFVPIGGQERADDVPARLSKNEFVFTADAVRNAGGGDIDKGAEIMENMMENLEAGGKVSEASQGLKGAREMFATQQRLGEVL